jgi:cytochrome c5
MDEIHVADHASFIKNWKQLLAVAVLAFIVPVFLIIAVVQIVTGGLKLDPRSPAMSEEAVAARLKPVGEVALAEVGAPPPETAPGAAPVAATQPPATAPAAAAAPAKAKSGDKVYQSSCAMCHAGGLAGAPKLGDKAAWQPRVAQGVPTLYAHALNGIRAMPARGGNASLSDAEVKAAVDYLVSKAK